jgi:hypothetical protein
MFRPRALNHGVVDMEVAAEKQYEFAFLGPLKLRGATGAPDAARSAAEGLAEVDLDDVLERRCGAVGAIPLEHGQRDGEVARRGRSNQTVISSSRVGRARRGSTFPNSATSSRPSPRVDGARDVAVVA